MALYEERTRFDSQLSRMKCPAPMTPERACYVAGLHQSMAEQLARPEFRPRRSRRTGRAPGGSTARLPRGPGSRMEGMLQRENMAVPVAVQQLQKELVTALEGVA